jgi:AmmeMemoRadiSam system protein B
MGVTPLQARARPPIVDGLFYPAERRPLLEKVKGLLAGSPTPEGSCLGIVSPHAGYEFAGETMASAYRAIARRPVRTAVLIGPVHRDPEDGFYLPESDLYSTPREAVAALLARGAGFRASDIPHLEEHCLEVQLPFLAHLFPGVRIVPILVGSAGAAAATALAGALLSVFAESGASTVTVVTANMASYMKGRDTEAENAALEELLAARDWRGIVAGAERRKISPCCAAGMAALILLAGSECRVSILARSSSRDRNEEEAKAVHYAAVSVDNAVLID